MRLQSREIRAICAISWALRRHLCYWCDRRVLTTRKDLRRGYGQVDGRGLASSPATLTQRLHNVLRKTTTPHDRSLDPPAMCRSREGPGTWITPETVWTTQRK